MLPVEWILLLDALLLIQVSPHERSQCKREWRMNVLVLVVYMLVSLLVCVCLHAFVHPHTAVCLCVFACLSHDVLWQSLTNHKGASRRLRWWGGKRGGMKRRRGGKRSYGAVEGGGALWLTAVTWWAYNEAKLRSNCWITANDSWPDLALCKHGASIQTSVIIISQNTFMSVWTLWQGRLFQPLEI